jgi:peptidoglycan/LPS O-acetylase OafA/YrhL
MQAQPRAHSAASIDGDAPHEGPRITAPSSRITGIDAARGCAMFLVCLSHIKQHTVPSYPDLHEALVLVTRIATPTFLLLSGFVIGHVLRSSRRSNVGISLLDRGLFLILIAHLLLGWTDIHQAGCTSGSLVEQ